MEDIGTIIWVLVVIGIAATNGMSKYRKARGKDNPHTGEAWPSMEGEEPMSPTQPGIPDIFGIPRHTPQQAAPRQVRQPNGEGSHPEPETAARPTVRQAPARHRAYEAHTPQGGTRQAQSTSSAPKAPNGAKITSTVATTGADNAPLGFENPLGEEFDLRKAVIYSEIMKPKFEE